MARRKCDDCGRFCTRLHDVWLNPRSRGIEREVCDDCKAVTSDD